MVEKSPPKVTAKHSRITGKPTMPAAFMPSTKGESEVTRMPKLLTGVIPTKKNCHRAFTANTTSGEMVRALGMLIWGNLTSAPIPATVSNPAKHHQTITMSLAKAVNSVGRPPNTVV